MAQGNQTFWDHLDELRHVIARAVVLTLLLAVAAFFFKEEVFAVVFAPKDSNFITYRILSEISQISGASAEAFDVTLINIGLARQFMVHMKMSVCVGLILASPYIIYQIFAFVSTALYAEERKHAITFVSWGYIFFAFGALLGYFLIFPLTFRFLGTYQVSESVANMISLESYISTLLTLCLLMGIVAEIPILCWLFAKLGILTPLFMRKYRRQAIVIILAVAAVITPTSDAFTLLAVSLPMWLLYEAGIWIAAKTVKNSSVPDRVRA